MDGIRHPGVGMVRSRMRQPEPVVAAVMMVRNERNIIATCLGHLLTTLGVSRVYVTDNGSSDGTPDILRGIAAATRRVVLDADPGAFRQGEVLTALARRAIADGADWVLPTDADEFLWLPPGRSLAELCGREAVGGYRVPVRNFLQAGPMRRDWIGSLATMCVSALPFGSVADGQQAVASGQIPFVRIHYPSKLLLRAAASLEVTFGHHDAHGAAGPLIPLEDGELLHAPIRCFADLRQRIEAGRRAAVVTPDPDQNWHLKRVAAMDEAALVEEWRRNTFVPWRPVRHGATQLDLRLCRIGLRQTGFRWRFHRSRVWQERP